ncbi:MAG: autotransporter-associated beta strand repeat-containing protein, partial [Thermoguttaceae bacterium]
AGAGNSLLVNNPAAMLVLSGSNTYLGGTAVESGTLIINNSGAIPDGSSLTVGAGGTFIFDPSVSGAAIAAGSLLHGAGVAVVPEPGTLTLLAVAMVVMIGAWRRRV